MKVTELLKQVGAKAGLLHLEEEVEQKIEITVWQKQIVSLQELQADADKAEQQALSAPPPEITVEFSRIFEALKIPPPEHGWGVDQLTEAMGDNISKSHEEAAKSAAAILKEKNIPPEDIIKDGINRDKALDSYEQFVAKKMEERAASRKNMMEELRQEIRQSEERIRNLEASQAHDEKNFDEWQNKKVQQEENLVRVVSLLTSETGISVGRTTKKR